MSLIIPTTVKDSLTDFGGEPDSYPNDVYLEMEKNYARWWDYYSGKVFQERVSGVGVPNDQDPPLLYPVGINLVKMLTNAQASALWGDWDDDIISFTVEPYGYLGGDSETARERAEHAKSLIEGAFRENNANCRLVEAGLSQCIYGGTYFKVSFDGSKASGIRLEKLGVQTVWPLWDPEDWDRLIEVTIRIPLSKRQAELRYGVSLEFWDDVVYRHERWTEAEYENILTDGSKNHVIRLEQFSGPNPYGFIPIVYIPRRRSESWWYGEPLTEEIIRVQDELNARIADIGEDINYITHRIIWGRNIKDFSDRNKFAIGPDLRWDLGKTIGGFEPEVGMLSPGDIPKGAYTYIDWVYDYARTAADSPPIVFGEDEGSQRSGTTLVIRMWPLTRALKVQRSYWSVGLTQMARMILDILYHKRRIGEELSRHIIYPNFAAILPKDRAELVDEIVKRLSTKPPTISLETALEKLGDIRDIPQEIERIEENMRQVQEYTGGPFNAGNQQDNSVPIPQQQD